MPDVKTTIETISPMRAAEMLTDNVLNRKLSSPDVVKIVRDLKAGRWQFNGDAIRFDVQGFLLDGQHRLKACVASGVSIKTIVLRGLPSEVRRTIDSGSKRTIGQRLQMDGVINANATGACITTMCQIAQRNIALVITPGEAEEVLAKHPDLTKSVMLCRRAFPLINSRLAALHYIGRYIGQREMADDFISVWRFGIPTYPGDAAHNAREKIMRTRGTSGALTPVNMARLVLHAFNLFLARKPVKSIRAPDDYLVAGWRGIDLFAPSPRGLESASMESHT